MDLATAPTHVLASAMRVDRWLQARFDSCASCSTCATTSLCGRGLWTSTVVVGVEGRTSTHRVAWMTRVLRDDGVRIGDGYVARRGRSALSDHRVGRKDRRENRPFLKGRERHKSNDMTSKGGQCIEQAKRKGSFRWERKKT